jgi:hypothetical protein
VSGHYAGRMTNGETAATARRLLDTNRYMTLATADASGRPWISPVWFAPAGEDELLWVSSPGRRHSENIAVRPQIAIVIFDSTVRVGEAEALYLEAVAGQVPEAEIEPAIARFSEHAQAGGAGIWTAANVVEPARLRLYRARITERSVLGPHDDRLPVRPLS